MEWDGTGLVRILSRPEDLNIALGGIDRRGDGSTQFLGGDSNAGTDDGQDQGIFGRRSAGLITNKRREQIAHVKTPLLNGMRWHRVDAHLFPFTI